MRGPINIWRLIRTGATFARTGALGQVLHAMNAPPLVKVATRTVSWTFAWLGRRGDPSLPPVTRAVTAMGPAYIKFGQILSTRPDVVGEEMAEQLQYLQDKLDPFPTDVARKTIERELEISVDDVFSEFSEAVAAASIAQVHRARIRATGQEVAVKVLRPRIERAFRTDLDTFHFAARVIELLLPQTRRLRPQDVVNHFENVVLGELDLRQEASSASEFAENTKGDAGFVVPAINWGLSSRRVMTMDWAGGTPANDLATLRASSLDLEAIGNRVLHLFLSHALRDGLFHGDMHQGNLKFAPNGDILAIDFGIMGRIDQYTRRVYAEILYGFIQRDYKRVAEVHFEAGYVPADKDVDEFARALRAVGEPIFGMDATQISMGRLLSYLFEVTEKFGMQTRTELIHLQRTMVIVEGVSRSLNPHINIWEVAGPVVEDYIAKAIGPKAVLEDLVKTVKVLSRFGPRLPELAEAALINQATPQKHVDRARPLRAMAYVVLGAGITLAAVLIEALL
ncbi:2-polyprenylphenol 6-hydroxylase [Maritimibacter sp. UBA3975]|mgnify:CR=1 FL=1|uniref:2-polyprenylphenol 6-hydroxylase n=1 Tax=Maritimibacter sp. UBA3975 TaxID=1946833 RepID=UPI000C0982AA|nr:2-polyprenylphenol 6-hydroxylase [Maritimibacter sp. UBA3975]MAM63550.1 2-polyprenylphenol 6-hydroxylase [Maritimibacter sp.]|tara:strand:+ start:57311 stop:58840 length:1530 start_codon:yes stop_codon:yes gene_type:complete